VKALVLNSGSSSQKCALYEMKEKLPENPPAPLWQADIEWNRDSAAVHVSTSQGNGFQTQEKVTDRAAAMQRLLQTLWSGPTRVIEGASQIDVVGHRVVHGGSKLAEPAVITPEVKKMIADASAFAPLHNRAELEGISLIEQLVPGTRQIAVFDTGFHRTLPLSAAVYPGPYSWFEQGIRRYGFHGINHQYCAERASFLVGRDLSSLKIISCHLGNGCSVAAIGEGKSLDTTMGFTPLEGLMMGTRSGSVDPGILIYLMRQSAITGEQLDDVLNQESGLLGISGISGDMREILTAINQGDSRARLAFEIYIHRLQSAIGAMAAGLAGIDVLIFTAGIGEHSSEIRAAACTNLIFLGVELDDDQNARAAPDCEISAAGSRVRVLIIRAQEDWAIAKICWAVLSQQQLRNPHGPAFPR
jgi:acetate kinase